MAYTGKIAKLFIELAMDNKLGAGIKVAKTQASGLSSAIEAHGVKMGAAMAGAGAAIMLAADQFHQAENNIRIGTGATGDALKVLEGDFNSLVGTVSADTDTISNAIANLNTQTGASGPALQKVTKEVLQFSRMMGEDGASNADAFGKALNQWGLSVEEGDVLLDKMFTTSQNTGLGFGELIGQLNTYGPVMQNAGFSTEETMDLFGQLNKAGISVSRVMPGLNASMRGWATEGKNSQVELSKAVTTIKNTKSATEQLAIATETFGAEGAQRLLTAINNNSFELEGLGEGMDDVEGKIASTAAETLTLTDHFTMFKDSAGQVLAGLEPLGAVLSVGGPLLMGLSGVIQVLPMLQTGMLALASNPLVLLVAAIVVLVLILWQLEERFGVVSKAIEWVSSGISKLVDWFKDFISGAKDTEEGSGGLGDTLLLLLGPIGMVILAFKNWDKIVGFVKDTFQKVKDFITGLFTWFSDAGSRLIEYLVDGILNSPLTPFGALKSLLGPVADLLPHSPAKEGPLSEEINWDSVLVLPMEKGGVKAHKYLASELADIHAELESASKDNLVIEPEITTPAVQALPVSDEQKYVSGLQSRAEAEGIMSLTKRERQILLTQGADAADGKWITTLKANQVSAPEWVKNPETEETGTGAETATTATTSETDEIATTAVSASTSAYEDGILSQDYATSGVDYTSIITEIKTGVSALSEIASNQLLAIKEGITAVTQSLNNQTGGGNTLHIENIYIRNEEDLDKMFKKWEDLQRTKRIQRGIRA